MKTTLFGILCILAIGIVGAVCVSLRDDINSIKRELDMMDAVTVESVQTLNDVTAHLTVLDDAIELHAKQLQQSSTNERMLAENDEAMLKVLQEMVRQLSQHHSALERLMRVRGYKMEI